MLYRRIYAPRRFNELISPKNKCNFFHKSSTQYQITSYNYTECGRKLQLYICGKVVHSNAIWRANIGSGNGLSPVCCKAITWISTEILSVGPWGANFGRISIKILFLFHSKKMHLKMLSPNWRSFCWGLDVFVNRHEVVPILTKISLSMILELCARSSSQGQEQVITCHSTCPNNTIYLKPVVIFFATFGVIWDSKVHGANMGPTWVLSAPDAPHVGPMNLAIRDVTKHQGVAKSVTK